MYLVFTYIHIYRYIYTYMYNKHMHTQTDTHTHTHSTHAPIQIPQGTSGRCWQRAHCQHTSRHLAWTGKISWRLVCFCIKMLQWNTQLKWTNHRCNFDKLGLGTQNDPKPHAVDLFSENYRIPSGHFGSFQRGLVLALTSATPSLRLAVLLQILSFREHGTSPGIFGYVWHV